MTALRLDLDDLWNPLFCTLERTASVLTDETRCARRPGCVRLPPSYIDEELRLLEMDPILRRSVKAQMQRLKVMCATAGFADPVLFDQDGEYHFVLAGQPPEGGKRVAVAA